MEYWVLTRLGKENIPLLQRSGREEEAKILKLLDSSEGATVERVAYEMHLDESAVTDRLKSMIGRRWVWQKITKSVSF